jgi:uncharacterized membrane protein (Fun14 family)
MVNFGFFLIGLGVGGLIGFLYGCHFTKKDFIEIIKMIEQDGEE